MRRFLAWPFVTILTLFILSFALTNRQDVMLGLFPLPIDFTVPLFLPILIASLLGLGAGLLIGWVQGGKERRQLHQKERDFLQASRELAALREKINYAATLSTQKSVLPSPLLSVPEESPL